MPVNLSAISGNIIDISENIPDMSGIILAIFEKSGQPEHKGTTIHYKPIN